MPRQGVVANTPGLLRNGAVGFIDWLAVCQWFWGGRKLNRPEDKLLIAGKVGDTAVDVEQDTVLVDHAFVINLTTWALRSKRNL